MASYYLRFAIASAFFAGLIAHVIGSVFSSFADTVAQFANIAPLS